MRGLTVALTASFLVSLAGAMSAAGEKAACALLSQADVSTTLGAPVPGGTPIASPASCQWIGKGKMATLVLRQPRDGRSPVDQFNAGKKTLAGITVEPVSGVGDDAYYVYFSKTTRAGLGLVVKKGSSAFEVRVYGFDLDKAKPVAKTLAQNAAGKL